PQRRERGAIALDELGRERHIALIEGDQGLPAVHREWVLVQDEAHAGTSARNASSPSSSRPVPCARSAGSSRPSRNTPCSAKIRRVAPPSSWRSSMVVNDTEVRRSSS